MWIQEDHLEVMAEEKNLGGGGFRVALQSLPKKKEEFES